MLSILFIAFLSLFALDVFGVGYSPWETLVALTMHLIPTFLLIAVLVAAWRWPWVGALAFCGFGCGTSMRRWGVFHWLVPLLMAGVPILVGLLFLGDRAMRRTGRRVKKTFDAKIRRIVDFRILTARKCKHLFLVVQFGSKCSQFWADLKCKLACSPGLR